MELSTGFNQELSGRDNIYLKFALQVEPKNSDIKNHIEFCKKLLQNNQATLPSSLKLELKINPFLRCDDDKLRESISHKYDSSKSIDDSSVFEYLRKWKDSFYFNKKTSIRSYCRIS